MDIFNDLLNGVTSAASGLWPAPQDHPSLQDGKLRPCPGTPNCVCSEADSGPFPVEPVSFSGEADAAWKRLAKVIRDMGGRIETDDGEYLWSTFTVPVFGFVDDVEFRLDGTAGVIHVRSASRLGFSDLGVNRARVDDIRHRMLA